jgi:hypothetical protein
VTAARYRGRLIRLDGAPPVCEIASLIERDVDVLKASVLGDACALAGGPEEKDNEGNRGSESEGRRR